MRASGSRTLGNRSRMRASGPRTQGKPMRASGPRTLVDDISGVMLNITLSVVIPSTSPFLSQMGEEGGWGEGEVPTLGGGPVARAS